MATLPVFQPARQAEGLSCGESDVAYKIVSGDNLGLIARNSGVTVAELLARNAGLRADAVLRAGEMLCVPRSNAPAGSVTTQSPGSSSTAPPISPTANDAGSRGRPPPDDSAVSSEEDTGSSGASFVLIIVVAILLVGGLAIFFVLRRPSEDKRDRHWLARHRRNLPTSDARGASSTELPTAPPTPASTEPVVTAIPSSVSKERAVDTDSPPAPRLNARPLVVHAGTEVPLKVPTSVKEDVDRVPRVRVTLVAPLPPPYDRKQPRRAIVETTLDPGGFIRIDDYLIVWATVDEDALRPLPGSPVEPFLPAEGQPEGR